MHHPHAPNGHFCPRILQVRETAQLIEIFLCRLLYRVFKDAKDTCVFTLDDLKRALNLEINSVQVVLGALSLYRGILDSLGAPDIV